MNTTDHWLPIDPTAPPRGLMLVSNNLDARDAKGERSHLWLTRAVYQVEDCDGNVFCVAYVEGSHVVVQNLTHYLPLE